MDPIRSTRRQTLCSMAALIGSAGLPLRVGASANASANGPAGEAASVIVIGAGLSGLNASLLLEEQGFKVILLEDSNRVGGRLLTLDDVLGQSEAGGSGIGRGYARLMYTAQKLGIPLGPKRTCTELARDATVIALGGQLFRPEQWAGHALNPYVGAQRTVMPWLMSFTALRPFNTLPDAASWSDPAHAAADVSVADLLTAKGWTPEQLRLAYATNSS